MDRQSKEKSYVSLFLFYIDGTVYSSKIIDGKL